MINKLFPTTVVGSMTRPGFFRDLVDYYLVEGGSEEKLDSLLDRAIPYVIALQEAAGLDIVSDGEWRRKSYIGVVSDIVTGFDLKKTHVDEFYGVKGFRHDAFVGYTIIEQIKSVNPGLFASEANFIKKYTDREARIAIPSAFQIADVTWDPQRSVNAYSSVRDFVEALVPVLRSELIALRDEGIRYVGFDDTSFGRIYDPAKKAEVSDYEERQEIAVDSFNRTVEGIEGLHISLHLCGKRPMGPNGESGYSFLLNDFKSMNLDMVMFELCDPDDADLNMLADLPENIDVGVGCVKAKQNEIDSPDEIVRRVKNVISTIEPHRNLMHPDCGFSPGAYWDVPLEEAYEKLSNQVIAAEILRKEFS